MAVGLRLGLIGYPAAVGSRMDWTAGPGRRRTPRPLPAPMFGARDPHRETAGRWGTDGYIRVPTATAGNLAGTVRDSWGAAWKEQPELITRR